MEEGGRVWSFVEECGAVWPTQEQKDFAASSYWRNLGAHDRAKIVQLFLCTGGVGLLLIVIVDTC